MPKRLELKPSELRRVCNPSQFAFKDTSELASPDTVIGQERAVQAIEFGLDMRSPGYNIFVTGAEGTGKSTIVRDLTARFAKTQPVPDDWCLVNNFSDEFRPRAVLRQEDQSARQRSEKGNPQGLRDGGLSEKAGHHQIPFQQPPAGHFPEDRTLRHRAQPAHRLLPEGIPRRARR
jgi:hypothetical protein